MWRHVEAVSGAAACVLSPRSSFPCRTPILKCESEEELVQVLLHKKLSRTDEKHCGYRHITSCCKREGTSHDLLNDGNKILKYLRV